MYLTVGNISFDVLDPGLLKNIALLGHGDERPGEPRASLLVEN